ncbi:MAG TPA: class I SAM-dependent methyltransferase [Bacteroidia bacterium]|nr:class I SAM-dependent methyltransferase [Bacteroidia bacterium]
MINSAETKFDKDEFSFAYPDGIENNYWNLARNKIILDTIRKYPVGNVLDVGSGRGVVTDYLFKNKINIKGVELGSTTAISHSKVPIEYGTDALSFSEEISSGYTTITLFDVIEHIEDPVKFINNLIAHFKNVTCLVVTVPARMELWTNFDEYYGHYKRYDLDTIKHEMEKCGFELIENKYFFQPLYLMIALNNKISKTRSIQFNVPSGITKIMHKLIARILYLFRFISPGSLYGSSIICVAKKIKK